jgi:hypothetical protein
MEGSVRVVITEQQIWELEIRARNAGDDAMIIITRIASLGEVYGAAEITDSICDWIDDPDARDELMGMTREKAWQECERVINGTLLTGQSG